MQKITPFFMFEGKAEEAMNVYTSLFADSQIQEITHYGAGEQGKEGSVKFATFTLSGQLYRCIDSYVNHGFTFTPSISMYVTCESEEEIDRLFEQLSDGGQTFMPLAPYPFSKKFGWVADKYGISWQLAL